MAGHGIDSWSCVLPPTRDATYEKGLAWKFIPTLYSKFCVSHEICLFPYANQFNMFVSPLLKHCLTGANTLVVCKLSKDERQKWKYR